MLYEKSHSVVQCDYVWKRTDQWINFPWSDKDPVAKRQGSVEDLDRRAPDLSDATGRPPASTLWMRSRTTLRAAPRRAGGRCATP